ncbi:MAG: arsenite efflux rane protein ArsB [Frankiales bacterium]|nr:arsenite efflux rane protein ArsB [Frankiales bacterium]
MWALLGIAGALSVLTGWLPREQAHEVAITRAGPVLAFLVAITVLAELADRAGVFEAAAGVCARTARGSTVRLFLLIAVLGTITTIGMSLDTTAVLLTPVVLTLTDRLGLRPLPFALLAVWLANTASLLLPVSNLTNLLAVRHLDLSATAFAGRMALPALAAVLVSVAYLGFLFRRDLATRYTLPAGRPAPDRWTFWVSAVACIALAPGVLLGAPPWAVAVPAAAVTGLVFAIRRRSELSLGLLPWRIVVFTEGLFLLVTAIARHGGTRVLADVIGQSTLGTAATAAAVSNAVNNLPAYLAVETAVPDGRTTQLLGALLGTNSGPLILLWGSLATLLWRERCRARGVQVSAWTFAKVGLGGVPLVIVASWAALLVTS